LELIRAIYNEPRETVSWPYDLKTSEIGTEILKLTRDDQADLVIFMKRWLENSWKPSIPADPETFVQRVHCDAVEAALQQLLSCKLPFTQDEVIELLNLVNKQHIWLYCSAAKIVKVVKDYLDNHELNSELKEEIKLAARKLSAHAYRSENKYGPKLAHLIEAENYILPINPGEAWSDRAIQQLYAIKAEQRQPWTRLMIECSTASASKPSVKWLKAGQSHKSKIEYQEFKQGVIGWFELVDQPRTQKLLGWQRDLDLISDTNADILKGLVWLCADLADREIARALGQLAISAYRKVPGIGPRCVKLGNACVWALGQMPGEFGIAQLARLKLKVKFGSAQNGIKKALEQAATRTGITRADIEELAVPTYGLSAIGHRRETLGDFTAELVVTGTHSTEIRWFKPDGTPQKSVPQAVKAHYSEALKALKQAAKDIQSMLPAQRDRIESLYLHQKTWDFATWKPRYLNHPLIATLARRLIWQFASGEHQALGIWLDGQLVDRENQPIGWLDDQTQVQLWHPIGAAPETILAWRNWLLDRQIPQPFKQAHREIYLLTAAEENTGTYSNRFAAHVIKQHQFNALCGQRGWKNALRLMVDDSFPPATLRLPQWGLRAEFWVEGIGDNYGTDTNETGTFLYLATDQVRFYPLESTENQAHAAGGNYAQYNMDSAEAAIPLEDIPALVFTEVMRDVDLFVGVASVGNDPNWSDGGPQGRHYDYWQSYSFGELSATATTRRQLLEILVPKLKIAHQCTFQDKFLVVQGDRRTYKIHLGSGNILMTPNDQYLCIVPGQNQQGPSQVFLPFEGDRTLAIILSKAFLLADDKRITDPTIVAQIQMGV
jgi:Domain of unknown function (DUF4132)